MKKKIKWTGILFALVLSIGLMGCSSSEDDTTDSSQENESTSAKDDEAIATAVKHMEEGDFDEAESALNGCFEGKAAELGGALGKYNYTVSVFFGNYGSMPMMDDVVAAGYKTGFQEAYDSFEEIDDIYKDYKPFKERINAWKAKEFHTAIFMSGEQSILQMADSTAGLRVRVMEFYNVVWTKSAESADCIKRICQSNYGWIVPLFAEFLLKQDKASLIQSCEKWSDEFLAEREGSSDDVLMARMSKKVGVILATAELAEQVIGVRIDVEYVKDFLLQHLMTDPEESDIGLKAYGEIISFMVEHPQEFGQAMNTPPEFKIEYFKMGRIVKGETVTLYDGRISNSILYISKEAFTHILEKASFKDIRIILKRLKELDLLVSEKDRYISKFKLGVEDVMIKGYRIRIPNGIQEEEDKDIESDKLILDDEIEWEEL